MGSAPVDDPASCDAGQTYPFEARTVNRNAWRMSSVPLASSYRINPGKMARPAASADVHPSGRRLSVERSKIAPDPASHRPRAAFQYGVVRLEELPAITIHDEHVVIAVRAAADAHRPRCSSPSSWPLGGRGSP